MERVIESGSLPPRPRNGHKGTFGHALLIAGSRGMIGAAILASRAALRSGAGLLTVASPESERRVVAAGVPSAMTLGLAETAGGALSHGTLRDVVEFAKRRRVNGLGIGPGLSRHPETQALVRSLLSEIALPTVLDADGIISFAAFPHDLRRPQTPTILTPHPGELAELTGRSVAEIQSNRETIASETAVDLQCIVVLKGNGTIVTDGVRLYVNRTGNPGMGTGGAGDVLTGIITGLIVQGFAPYESTVLGVHVHGISGDLAALRLGEASVTAEDLVVELPAAFQRLSGPHLANDRWETT